MHTTGSPEYNLLLQSESVASFPFCRNPVVTLVVIDHFNDLSSMLFNVCISMFGLLQAMIGLGSAGVEIEQRIVTSTNVYVYIYLSPSLSLSLSLSLSGYIYIYIYICVYVRASDLSGPSPSSPLLLAQDKGGSSKGGFLNYLSCSYTDMYSCNGINGM